MAVFGRTIAAFLLIRFRFAILARLGDGLRVRHALYRMRVRDAGDVMIHFEFSLISWLRVGGRILFVIGDLAISGLWLADASAIVLIKLMIWAYLWSIPVCT